MNQAPATSGRVQGRRRRVGTIANHGVAIEVAGLPFLIESDSAEFLHLVATRTAWLTATGSRQPVLNIHYTVTPGDHTWPREGGPPFSIEGSGTAARIVGEFFAATVDLTTRSVRASGPLSLFLIDTIIRAVLPELFGDVLLLHSCVLARDNKAWVCSGPSGAGKSTLLSLLPGLAVGDELAILTRHRDTLCVRPLWTDERNRRSLEVESVFLLEHGNRHSRRAVGPAEGFRRLARETSWPILSSEATERTFVMLAWLIDHASLWNLRFTPDPGVLEALGG